jgi:hypothetical protein
MARDTDQLTGSFDTENTGGLLSGFLADEDAFDRRSLWRIGSWGVGAVGAVVVAVLANQSQISLRREQFAAADLARQAQQIQLVAKESQNETRRLASAVDTLNGDRDRLYSRVTVLEQGLDSVTGAISRQSAAVTPPQAAAKPPASATEPQAAAQSPAPVAAAPAPVVAPVMTTVAKSAEKPPMDTTAPEQAPATVASIAQKPKAQDMPAPTPATPLVAAKSMMAPPDAAATKLIEPDKPAKPVTAAPMPDVVASAPPADDPAPDAVEPPPAPAALADVAVQRTEFGVDVGGANSVGGLRALWRGLLKSKSNAALTTLRPIIVIREGKGGFGMQLRVVAGPLSGAAAAAKICAGLMEKDRTCQTTVFDGQRLAMKADEPAAGDAKFAMDKPAAVKPIAHKRSAPKRAANDDATKKLDPPSTLSSFFGRR